MADMTVGKTTLLSFLT